MASKPCNNLRNFNYISTSEPPFYSKPNLSISLPVDGLKRNNMSFGQNLVDPRSEPRNATIENDTPFSETLECNQLDSQVEIATSKRASLVVFSQNPTTKPEHSNFENAANNSICEISRDSPIEQSNADLSVFGKEYKFPRASSSNSDSGASYNFNLNLNTNQGSEQPANIPDSDSASNKLNSLQSLDLLNANRSSISLYSNGDLEKVQDEFRNEIIMATNDKNCIIPCIEGHAELPPGDDHLAALCSKSLPDTSISSSSHASLSPPHRGSHYVRSKRNIMLTEPSSEQVFFW